MKRRLIEGPEIPHTGYRFPAQPVICIHFSAVSDSRARRATLVGCGLSFFGELDESNMIHVDVPERSNPSFVMDRLIKTGIVAEVRLVPDPRGARKKY